ncbi:hypothetical protein [Gordonia sp. NB41Y]|uniref:hypothetical protein n=1 Tax=Gordonia sp. NB41Y TaxID=875808 RepID=UPI0002BF90E8|nr:hypothetical protein [Gordonia sp. NB41Y]EMP10609.1 hypothetical protein ISGA_3294 [Gordonia sp. NB41Y]WLP90140.1 hypothetical protein Q9K23_21880 [Gordonia sp. NB41Y]
MIEQHDLAPHTTVDFDKLSPTDQDVLAPARPTVVETSATWRWNAPTNKRVTTRHQPPEVSTRLVATLLTGSTSKNHTPRPRAVACLD